MVGRRSRFEIYVDILTEIKRGTGLPTRIMYGTNVSWNPLKNTLEKLKAKDSSRSNRFTATRYQIEPIL